MRLSERQKWILLKLARVEVSLLENYTELGCRRLEVWGIPWRPGKWHFEWSAADASSASRALRRLEECGLVLRQNDRSGCPATGKARRDSGDPHDRTTHVMLTAAGRDVLAQLTKPNSPDVNRCTVEALL